MNALAELLTVTARWQDWTDPRFVTPVLIEAMVDPAVPLLPPLQPFDKVRQMYAALGREDTDLGRRALDQMRRERAVEGFDDPDRT